jgi:hypothetical protein
MVKLKIKREKIIKKAEQLAVKYEAKYKGCGQCTYLAIIDALRWGGLELISEEMEDRFFSGICILTGGVGMTGDGTCGAVASSVLAIGIALGIPRENQDDSILRAGCAAVRNTIIEKYQREYGSILCKDVQRKYFGEAWDLTKDKMSKEFLSVTHGCTIMQTSA